MSINYRTESDKLIFSKVRTSISVSNISNFWEALLSNPTLQRVNYCTLEGENIVSTSTQVGHPGDGEFESYSGNRIEITTEFYKNLVLINMIFYLQEFHFTAYCDASGKSDYSRQFNDTKSYLTVYLSTDHILNFVPATISRDKITHFMQQLEKMSEHQLQYLNLEEKLISWTYH